MPDYDIEIGEKRKASVCHCCGKDSCNGHGFIYKNNDAYAVYYVGWSNFHTEKKVSFALAIGEWDDDSTSEDRTCFGLEAYEDDQQILFRVIDPVESPWPDTDLLGKMLTRDESKKNELLEEVFYIAEYIVRNHIAISDYLKVN